MVRLKHRYFVLELTPPGEDSRSRLTVAEDAIYRAVLEAVSQIHGDYGVSAVKTRLIVKYSSAVTHVVLLRVAHSAHRLLATALPFMTSLEGQPITPRTLYLGATIMHCFKFLKRHQEGVLEKMWSSSDPHRRKQMREAIMSLTLPNIAETRSLPGV